ncbi:acetylornithine deacetylase [Verticiella sediminum]|uniref:Acetylornithine deacetylase n=1 Tax=Verticiella sediminum TaxID=1247510 RepID=A0A556AQ16_9BURK|nr:acetylornithine deacetylase [Verticiella sediminum]TSH94970.1 acetylornithine deacetylase [Verticiella sediminum]
MNDSRSLDYLKTLIGFPTVTSGSNLDLIEWVRCELSRHGVPCELVPDHTGTKANLHAVVGPSDKPGIMLSGHTDVVPVAGQDWTVPPFESTERDGRIYGRGAADMKGYVACALNALIAAKQMPLSRPLHLALSYDEEIGCVGVHSLLDVLVQRITRPSLCIIGEPTSMNIALGHKGKLALRAHCRGRAGHSALAPKALNAVHLATDFIGSLRRTQEDLARHGARDDDYEIPYSTLHVGRISGGTALNIVPSLCTLDFEIRHLAADAPDEILDRLQLEASHIVQPLKAAFPEAAIDIETMNAYPGLNTEAATEAARLVALLLPPSTRTFKVAFGTEGGLFTQRLGVATVVCGPGSMDQGHKPDEFVSIEQMRQCDGFLAKVTTTLAA